jgi:Na+/melibiose symporter-like transporter
MLVTNKLTLNKEKIMLTNMQKIGMAVALLASCIVLAMAAFASGWDHMPDNQKELLVQTGYWVTALLAIGSSIYSIFFVYTSQNDKFLEEMTEYNNRMANQFNVGRCYSPRHWLDADDYRRLAAGSRN